MSMLSLEGMWVCGACGVVLRHKQVMQSVLIFARWNVQADSCRIFIVGQHAGCSNCERGVYPTRAAGYVATATEAFGAHRLCQLASAGVGCLVCLCYVFVDSSAVMCRNWQFLQGAACYSSCGHARALTMGTRPIVYLHVFSYTYTTDACRAHFLPGASEQLSLLAEPGIFCTGCRSCSPGSLLQLHSALFEMLCNDVLVHHAVQMRVQWKTCLSAVTYHEQVYHQVLFTLL